MDPPDQFIIRRNRRELSCPILRTSWITTHAMLTIPLVAALIVTAGSASAQYGPDPDTPARTSKSFRLTCPGDIAVGDLLDEQCDPVSGEQLSIDGGTPATDETNEAGAGGFDDLDETGTYTVSSDGIASDEVSLITCNAGIGESSAELRWACRALTPRWTPRSMALRSSCPAPVRPVPAVCRVTGSTFPPAQSTVTRPPWSFMTRRTRMCRAAPRTAISF